MLCSSLNGINFNIIINTRHAVSIPKGTFSLDKLWKPIGQASSKPWLCLDPNLDGLHGAESYICNHLSGCRCGKVYDGFQPVSILGASNVRVALLEVLVEPKLARSLAAIPNQRGHPAFEEPTKTLLLEQHTKAR